MRSSIALLLLTIAITSCGQLGALSPHEARVRALHAATDVPAIDLVVDDAVAASGLTFKNATSYLTVAPGTRDLKVNLAGTSTTALNVKPTLAAGHFYTAVAAGTLANKDLTTLLFDDTTPEPAPGKAKLRLIHAASQAPTVDIYVTTPGAALAEATPTLSKVAYQQASVYLEVPAGAYQVRVTPSGSKTVVIDTGSVTLSAGQVRTGVALDPSSSGGAFQAALLADRN